MLKRLKNYYSVVLWTTCLTLSCNDVNPDKPRGFYGPALKIVPSTPSDSNSLYNLVKMESYTYTRSKAIFSPLGIRLGGKTPDADKRISKLTKKGNHLHLNMDNKEHYISNENVFNYEIKNGKHKLFAFICRSYNESIKNDNAIIAKEIEVFNGELIKSKNLELADIVYNSPRGTYKNSNTKNIVLDFVLINTDLHQEGNCVRITIDESKEFIVNKWQAYYIQNTQPGKHTVKLELLNAAQKLIAAPVSHDFTVVIESDSK
ncbi:MAG: hypothetical protein MK207_09275 [Saprospiraceae bacterium]|nr:hypothetical protein [Saprospiraceae bacterium]